MAPTVSPAFGRIPRLAAVGWMVCLLAAAPTWASGAATKPPPPVTNTNTNSNTSASTSDAAAPEPAPSRSPLDSEPIRRRGADTGGAPPPAEHPQGFELSRVGIALAIVIALILLLRWGGRKLFHQGGLSRSTRAVQVLARAPLAPRQHIVLVRVGRRVIVVGDCGSQMNPLCEITDGDEVAALLGQLQDEKVTLPAKAFSSLFQRARGAIGGDVADEESGAVVDTDEPPRMDPEPEVEPAASAPPDEPGISETRSEITGLMAKIRVLSSHFRDGQA